jgi:membrane-associated phospholipid phosphatase
MDRGVPGDEDRLASNRHVTAAMTAYSPPAPSERRGLLLLMLATLGLFVPLALWASLHAEAAWESGVLNALALGSDPWGDVMRLVNSLGGLAVWTVIVGVCSIAIGVLRGFIGASLVALSFAADLLAFAVKIVVQRDRPETAASEHFFGPDSFSFPSGHVVRAVALAAALVWVLAPVRLRFRLAVGAGVAAWLVMGYARVSLGVHWPTDTVGGALLGVAWFGLTAALLGSRT